MFQIKASQVNTHLETFGGLEQRRQLTVLDVHLALVHELDEGAQLAEPDVLQDDDGMPAGMVDEQRLEVGGAGGQDYLVGAYRVALRAGQRHVDEALVPEKLAEYSQ